MANNNNTVASASEKINYFFKKIIMYVLSLEYHIVANSAQLQGETQAWCLIVNV